jgi:LemA protein
MALAPTRRFSAPVLVIATALTLGGCGVNNIPTYENDAKAKWAEVMNQYKRRTDLIPNLVETVKGFAEQERKVLTEVIEARAKATSVQVPADILSNPEAMKRFQEHARWGAGPVDGGVGALSRHQVEPELPGAAAAA